MNRRLFFSVVSGIACCVGLGMLVETDKQKFVRLCSAFLKKHETWFRKHFQDGQSLEWHASRLYEDLKELVDRYETRNVHVAFGYSCSTNIKVFVHGMNSSAWHGLSNVNFPHQFLYRLA